MQFEITANLIIIIVTIALSLMAFKNHELKKDLIFHPVTVNGGDYYRFVSYGFIHADFNHLLFNMVTLYFFGSIIESLYNPYLSGFGFYIFYIVGLFVSILPSYITNRHNPAYASLGASGSVSAVLFAFVLVEPWAQLGVFFVIPMPAIIFAALYTAYSVYASKRMADNINHSAHMWGAAYGVLVTAIIRPDLLSAFFVKLFNP